MGFQDPHPPYSIDTRQDILEGVEAGLLQNLVEVAPTVLAESNWEVV